MVTPAQQTWVSRVLRVEIAEETVTDDSDGPAFSKSVMAERLQIISEDARGAGVLAQIAAALKLAAQAVKDDAPDAGRLLDQLEEEIAASINAKRRQQMSGEIQKATITANAGLVEMAKLRLKLLALKGSYDAAGVNLEQACLALLKTPDFIDDARSTLPETLDAIDGIGERVPDVRVLVDHIESVLDDIANDADPANRAVLVRDILGEIDGYKAKLEEEPFLKTMEKTPAGNFAIYSAVAGAVDDLAQTLRA